MRRFNPEKELYKIQHGGRNKTIAFAFLLLVVGVIGYSFALYQVRYSKRIIYTKVAPFSSHDLDLAIYVDGKPDKLPEKGKGYYYESITCESDPNAIAGWDYTNWKIGTLSVTVPNKCNINFTSHPTTLIEQIKYVKGINDDMVVDDETQDHNLRYIGAKPNNYIWFNCDSYDGLTSLNAEDGKHNCEKWWVIGLFKDINVVDGENTTKQDLVKIIRADSVGNIAWASSNSNNWTTASLQKSLINYYNGSTLNNKKGITSVTKNMIERVTWTIGGNSSTGTASQFYTAERGSTTPGGAPVTWNGYIGLMYPSDYGYATGGGDSVTRASCLEKELSIWSTDNYKTDCADNDWLLDTSTTQWTITPISFLYTGVYHVVSNGYVDGTDASRESSIRPSLYLKSSVKIKSGDGNGSSGTPYILVP